MRLASFAASASARASFLRWRMPVSCITASGLDFGACVAARGARRRVAVMRDRRTPRVRDTRAATAAGDSRSATISATRFALARAAAPHRLAQPGDDRAALRDRRWRAARRAHALRSSTRRRRGRSQTSAARIPPNVEAVLGARPDLVLLYASDDNREPRGEAARRRRPHVDVPDRPHRGLSSRGRDSSVASPAIRRGGAVVDSVECARSTRVRAATQGTLRSPRCSGNAWDQPLIAIGGGSFLTELVDIAGGKNIYGDDPRPVADVTIEDVVTARSRRRPRWAGIAAQRMRAAPAWRALRAVRDGRILIVDTMLVGRPGVRLGEAAVSLARLLHPGRCRERDVLDHGAL